MLRSTQWSEAPFPLLAIGIRIRPMNLLAFGSDQICNSQECLPVGHDLLVRTKNDPGDLGLRPSPLPGTMLALVAAASKWLSNKGAMRS